jgi:hypothetical protein
VAPSEAFGEKMIEVFELIFFIVVISAGSGIFGGVEIFGE